MQAVKRLNYQFRSNEFKFVIGIAASVVGLLFIVETQDANTIQYLNYSSEKYQIQFQYPSDWTLHEKANRFETGSDITVSNNNIASGQIAIGYKNNLLKNYGTVDLQTAVNELYKGLTGDYSYDYQTIESPSYTNIDGHRTGTFLITFEQKYETTPIKGASQFWVTFIGNNGYSVNFIATPDTFDSPENIEIRDHLIKSIKFLGVRNSTAGNEPSRF